MPYDPGDYMAWLQAGGFGGPGTGFNPPWDGEYDGYRWWLDPNYLASISSGYGGLFGGDRGSTGGGGASVGAMPANSLPGGYDSQSGLPHDLTQEIWNLGPPEGFDTSGFDAGSFVQRGLPIWASQRFQEMADQLGGWDKLQAWLNDATNWSTVLGIMRNPWGQSTYDTYPQANAPTQPTAQPNEGQTTNVPEGQGGPTGVDAEGNPTYGTDVTGQQYEEWLAGLGLGAGAAAGVGLGTVLSGGAGSAPLPMPQPGPVFTATGTATSTDPLGGGGLSTGPPTFSTTVTAEAPPPNPWGVNGPTLGGPISTAPPAESLPPPPILVPTPEATTTAPAGPTTQPTQPSGGAAAAAALTGGAGVSIPAAFPTLPAHQPISSLFQLPTFPGFAPGLNQILRGGF